jgi:hypothetical protein
MKDYFYLNPSKMIELSKILGNSEIKMMLGIMYCLSITGEEWFVNNAENRSRIASIGFNKTPERISTQLGSMTKKGVLKREANGVYSIPEGLFIVP